jgi:hypothetical protein
MVFEIVSKIRLPLWSELRLYGAINTISTAKNYNIVMTVGLCWFAILLAAVLCRPILTKKIDIFVVGSGQCNTGHISNAGSLNTLDDLSGYSVGGNCLPAGGFQSGSSALSKGTVGSLRNKLGSKGFSVELWVQPLRKLVSAAPILSFGGDKVSAYACANNFVVSADKANSAWFQLSQSKTLGVLLIRSAKTPPFRAMRQPQQVVYCTRNHGLRTHLKKCSM